VRDCREGNDPRWGEILGSRSKRVRKHCF